MKTIEEVIQEAQSLPKYDDLGTRNLWSVLGILEGYTTSLEDFTKAGFRLETRPKLGCAFVYHNPATGEDVELATVAAWDIEKYTSPAPMWMVLEWGRIANRMGRIDPNRGDDPVWVREEREEFQRLRKVREGDSRPVAIPFHGEKDWW